MNILILGSGGRECAFAWKLSQSNLCTSLFIAPGNAGTSLYGENVSLNIFDFEEVKSFCLEKKIGILLPGGEDTLVAGIYDYFKSEPSLSDIIVVGPSQAGAKLEGSKSFAKEFMQRYQIPTAAYKEFDTHNFEEGLEYIENHELPIVIKADGLAAGKGVVITSDKQEAKDIFTSMIKDARFGEAGKKVVIEKFLEGIELSVFVLTDGTHYALLPEAKDYKRIGEGDTGPNTGGMGAVSPVPFADSELMQKIITRIIEPTINGLKKEQIVYKGFIFFGLIRVNNDPYVIEYNCRMGDPETEVVLPRLENDLVDLFIKMSQEQLNDTLILHHKEAACTVMLVSAGYPEQYEKGKIISGIKDTTNSFIFHAGTTLAGGNTTTNGGRVLTVTSLAPSLEDALKQSYSNVDKIKFEGKNYRRDIGNEFI